MKADTILGKAKFKKLESPVLLFVNNDINSDQAVIVSLERTGAYLLIDREQEVILAVDTAGKTYKILSSTPLYRIEIQE